MDEKPTIVEMNSAIAAWFDGEVRWEYKIGKYEQYSWFGEQAKKYRYEKMGFTIGEAIRVEQLKFHESFDWLMPVWIKMRHELRDNRNYAISLHLSDIKGALIEGNMERFHYCVFSLINHLENG